MWMRQQRTKRSSWRNRPPGRRQFPLGLDPGRQGAQLLQKGEQIRHAPMLDDLAVPHAHGVDGFKVEGSRRAHPCMHRHSVA